MGNKLSGYGLEKIDLKELGNLDLNKFLCSLKDKYVEVAAVIPFEKGAEFAEYLLDDLQIDPEECILYPEGLNGIVYYDEDNYEMAFGDYKYLVIFKEKDLKYDESVYWYSAYKSLENLSKEIELLD